MTDYPLSPLGARCSRTIAFWCPTHGVPLVEVDPNVWDCPMGALEALAEEARAIESAVVLSDQYRRAVKILAASPVWPKDYLAMTTEPEA